MANSSINFSDLDFAPLKSAFITWLQGQDQFKDYNFAGSNFNVLLDVQAYNTFINAFINNMSLNEMFLDSSQLRDSIVSHAKELNYTPRSYRSASSIVNISVIPVGDPGQVIIPAGTIFNATSNNSVFLFSPAEDIIITSNNGSYISANVAIYEGFYVTENFIVDNTIQNQQFIMSNPQIDTTSLVVTVQNSTTDSTNGIYTQATSLFGYGPTSNIYFLQAATANTYQVLFGDGNIGNPLKNGNVITTKYRVASGDSPNSIVTFSPAIPSNSSVVSMSVTTISNTAGGSVSESNSSIQFYAPRSYQAQERAVTVDDFENLLFTNFPEIDALNIYGGETLIPPQFGKVIISASVSGLDGFSDAQGAEFINFLQNKVTVGITPVMVQPDFIYSSITSDVNYNVNVTNFSPSDITSIVTQSILNFNEENLDNFGITFRYTKLFSAIDNADPSIVSADTRILQFMKLVPTLNTSQNYVLDFLNPIESGDIPQSSVLPGENASIFSTAFTWSGIAGCILTDDGMGNINVVVANSNGNNYKPYNILQQIGTVDYVNGIIKINNFNVSQFNGTEIRIYTNLAIQNPSVTGNIILTISPDEIFVNATAVRV